MLATAVLAIAAALAPCSAVAQLKQPQSPVARPAKPLDDLRIGLVLSGGAYTATSEDIAAGVGLAIAEGGPIAGRALVVLRADSDGTTGAAAETARALLAGASLEALIGPAAPGDIATLRELAAADHIPLLVPMAAPALRGARACSPYVIQLTPPDDQLAASLGGWLAAQKPARQLYLLGPADPAGRGQVAAFRQRFEAGGGEIVGEEYVSGASPDFSPYFAKLRLVGADTIYAPFGGTAADALVKQYEEAGLSKRLGLLGGASPPRTPGAMWVSDYAPSLASPENARFRAEFSKRFGRAPTAAAARGYDAGRLLVDALRLPVVGPQDHERLAAALARVSFMGPRGTIHVDPERGAAVEEIAVLRAHDAATPGDDVVERVMWAPAANPCAAPAVN